MAGVTIPARDSKAFRFDELRGNWVFPMADSGNCDDYCESKLYIMRRTRLTQDKDQERIERIWLITDGVRPPPGIEAVYQGTRTILLGTDDFLARLPASDSPRRHLRHRPVEQSDDVISAQRRSATDEKGRQQVDEDFRRLDPNREVTRE